MISWILTKPPVNQKPVEQKSDSKTSSLNGTSGLSLMPLLKRGNGRKGRNGKRSRAPSLPPTLEAVILATHTFRFQALTGFGPLVNITGGCLAGITGGLCSVTNSVVTCPASSMRIHRVTIWPPAQAVPQNPPMVTWFSPITIMERDESKERILPAGITVDRPLVSKPPANTLCSDWFASVSANNQPMFGLTNIAAGSIIDVSLSFTISNNLLGVNRTVTTGVIATWYYLYLDGSTSHYLEPVGKLSTF